MLRPSERRCRPGRPRSPQASEHPVHAGAEEIAKGGATAPRVSDPVHRPPSGLNNMDPVTFSVLARRFETVARTMQHTLVRASRSGVIASGHDCSCCILSGRDELLSAAQTIPIHVFSGADLMAKTMKRFHPELERGDAFLHNSPYHGCTHAADLSVLVPVLDSGGVHRFTVLAKAHQADIGNSKPTTYMAGARDLYEEGALIFAATRIQKRYEMQTDIVRIGQMRIRAPEQWYGDLLALIGAARSGERALEALGEEFGWDVLERFANEWLDYSESAVRRVIRSLPRGKALGTSCHDPFPGTPESGIEVRAEVEIIPERERIVVDLRDNPDCLPCGLNMSEATSRSAALIGVFNSLGKDLPANSASASRVEVRLRKNCIVGIPNATTSCSVATTNLADRVANAVHKAMAAIDPKLGMAESGAIEGPAGAVLSGYDSRHGDRPYINQLALAGTAGGASPRGDGWLTLGNACSAGMWTMDSVEIDELNYPFRVDERMLLPDSEGAGRHRGTPCCRVVYQPIGGPMRLHYACDGVVNAARGVDGGGDAAPARQWIQRQDGTTSELPGIGDLVTEAGDRIVAHTSGGGGFGDPKRRPVDAVCKDVRAGLISPERAREVYAVVCNESGEPAHEETARLRRTHDERYSA